MNRIIPEPRIYKHEVLMHDLNDLHIRIKTHLFDVGDAEFKHQHPKPTVTELDQMLNKIMAVLQEDSQPAKKIKTQSLNHDIIISTENLSEYQLEIRTQLRKNFSNLSIEIGRGDRLMVNGKIISGFTVYDVRNRKDYEGDIKVFSEEITRHISKNIKP